MSIKGNLQGVEEISQHQGKFSSILLNGFNLQGAPSCEVSVKEQHQGIEEISQTLPKEYFLLKSVNPQDQGIEEISLPQGNKQFLLKEFASPDAPDQISQPRETEQVNPPSDISVKDQPQGTDQIFLKGASNHDAPLSISKGPTPRNDQLLPKEANPHNTPSEKSAKSVPLQTTEQAETSSNQDKSSIHLSVGSPMTSPGTTSFSVLQNHNTFQNIHQQSQMPTQVDLSDNCYQLICRQNNWVVEKYGPHQQFNPAVVDSIAEFFSGMKAVHRCSKETLKKIVPLKVMCSRHYLQTIADVPENINDDIPLKEVLFNLPAVKDILKYCKQEDLFELLIAMVEDIKHSNMSHPPPENEGEGGMHVKSCFTKNKIKLLNQFELKLSEPTLNQLNKEVEDHLKACQLLSKIPGVGYDKDVIFETNKTIFCVLGPHTLNYSKEPDGGVHIIFKLKILHHPDIFILPCAATLYSKDSTAFDNKKIRPWGLNTKLDMKHVKRMTAEKLHPSSPLFSKALALEFLCRVALLKEKRPSAVTEEDFLEYIRNTNAHMMPECHLPYVTPLDWIEKVIISAEGFEGFDEQTKKEIERVFGERLKKVKGHTDKVQYEHICASPHPSYYPCYSFTIRHVDCYLPVIIFNRPFWIFFMTSQSPFQLHLLGDNNKTKKLNTACYLDVRKGTVTLSINENNFVIPKIQSKDLSFFCLYYSPKEMKILNEEFGGGRGEQREECFGRMEKVQSIMFYSKKMTAFKDVRVLFDEKEMLPQEKELLIKEHSCQRGFWIGKKS
eukprot:TRINITY_DN25220_c0_g1_i1.p1 TRINITY_DN25220_c0_g1~~TRINITY_DN25220_c0_g1_i1.p1  ORF type:complete len:813 (+),score=223.93 TRINITY_DN25220_c0_g1_i1:97-2439(+)